MKKIAFLLSGNGGFVKFVYKRKNILKNFDLALVLTDRECEAFSFFSKQQDVNTRLINFKTFNTKTEFEQKIISELKNNKVDYLVLNYNRLVGPTLLSFMPNKVFNMHLSLLPLFKGFGAIEASFNSDILFTGATFHMVDDQVDGGPILGQFVLSKMIDESIESFKDRFYHCSRLFFLDMIQKLCNYEIQNNGNRYFFKGADYGSLPYNPKLLLED
ncbi:MAG: hypothetical protein KF816_10060 [Melioribacteraceae bacterium]|nr:hypothetical protein [Melioribacteraceae bacterium]